MNPFYEGFSLKSYYDYFKKEGKDVRSVINYGTNSRDYASKVNPNVFSIVGEIPYISDPKVVDQSKTGLPRRHFLENKYKMMSRIFNFIDENIRNGGIDKNIIFYDLLVDLISRGKSSLQAFHDNLSNSGSHVSDGSG